jgi:ketosteroid isomerase-like protein
MRKRAVLLLVATVCSYAVLVGRAVVGRPSGGASGALSHRSDPTSSRANKDESQIRELLAAQADTWNRGDIDSFLTAYWTSDETLFVGAKGVTRGWQAVLDRYHKAYPNRQAMGRLTFSNLEVHIDCPNAATVIGQFHLQRVNDRPEGVFTLNLRKFPEGWRIVVDHTTAFSPP